MANLRLTQILADAGHTVDVITYPFGSDPDIQGVKVHRCGPVPFIRSVRIGFSGAKLLLDFSLAYAALRLARRNRFDCIHAVEEGVFIGLPLSRLVRVPIVYDMDSVMSHEIARTAFGRLPGAARFVRAAERWAIKRSALVMTISESMADYVRQIDPSKDVAVVPDIPIRLPTGGPNPEAARAQLPVECVESRKIVMYTGSFAAYQGLDLLISAMARVAARVPEAVLVIVGGDEKATKRLAGAAQSAGVMQNLVLVGKKLPGQIPDFLSAADVLISPRRGGINPPAKIYTYMQSGKPIVATDIPAHTTVLSRDAAILVEPSPDGIAEGIVWILAHSEEAARMASRAQEIVSGITPELQARRVRDGYEILKAKIGDSGRACGGLSRE